MVDSNQLNIAFIPQLELVQIPLWSIVTRKAVRDVMKAGGSNSSMVDSNQARQTSPAAVVLMFKFLYGR